MKKLPAAFVAIALVANGLPLMPAAQRDREPAVSPELRKTDSGASNSKDYLLQPQDSLRVQVYQEDDISRQGDVTISAEYSIFLPLIGTISLKGKTARQTEGMIRDLYDKDYLVNPQVSVTVTRYAERTFNIFGSVGSPGRKSIPPERTLTILDAISVAGGASRIGELKKVKLTRNKPDGDTETITINVDELMKGTVTGNRETIYIQPDDVIFVPERFL